MRKRQKTSFRNQNVHGLILFGRKYTAPGHGTLSLQTWSSLESPSHFLPPYSGAGASHVRFLDCFPCLHVFVQVLQALLFTQLPSTEQVFDDIYFVEIQLEIVFIHCFCRYKRFTCKRSCLMHPSSTKSKEGLQTSKFILQTYKVWTPDFWFVCTLDSILTSWVSFSHKYVLIRFRFLSKVMPIWIHFSNKLIKQTFT